MSTGELIHASLFGKWNGSSERYIPRYSEWWYRLKAAVCLLLNLKCRGEEAQRDYWENKVMITILRGGSGYVPGEPTYYWWEGIVVGHGLFCNWWAEYESEST